MSTGKSETHRLNTADPAEGKTGIRTRSRVGNESIGLLWRDDRNKKVGVIKWTNLMLTFLSRSFSLLSKLSGGHSSLFPLPLVFIWMFELECVFVNRLQSVGGRRWVCSRSFPTPPLPFSSFFCATGSLSWVEEVSRSLNVMEEVGKCGCVSEESPALNSGVSLSYILAVFTITSINYDIII